jgi:hypothetical protein
MTMGYIIFRKWGLYYYYFICLSYFLELCAFCWPYYIDHNFLFRSALSKLSVMAAMDNIWDREPEGSKIVVKTCEL